MVRENAKVGTVEHRFFYATLHHGECLDRDSEILVINVPLHLFQWRSLEPKFRKNSRCSAVSVGKDICLPAKQPHSNILPFVNNLLNEWQITRKNLCPPTHTLCSFLFIPYVPGLRADLTSAKEHRRGKDFPFPCSSAEVKSALHRLP